MRGALPILSSMLLVSGALLGATCSTPSQCTQELVQAAKANRRDLSLVFPNDEVRDKAARLVSFGSDAVPYLRSLLHGSNGEAAADAGAFAVQLLGAQGVDLADDLEYATRAGNWIAPKTLAGLGNEGWRRLTRVALDPNIPGPRDPGLHDATPICFLVDCHKLDKDTLMVGTTSPDPRVRKRAADLLAFLGVHDTSPGHFDDLRHRLSSPDRESRLAAYVEAAELEQDAEPLSESIRSRIAQADNDERLSIVSCLGSIRDVKAEQEISEQITASDWMLAYRSVEALGRISGGKPSHPATLQLQTAATNYWLPEVRSAALAILSGHAPTDREAWGVPEMQNCGPLRPRGGTTDDQSVFSLKVALGPSTLIPPGTTWTTLHDDESKQMIVGANGGEFFGGLWAAPQSGVFTILSGLNTYSLAGWHSDVVAAQQTGTDALYNTATLFRYHYSNGFWTSTFLFRSPGIPSRVRVNWRNKLSVVTDAGTASLDPRGNVAYSADRCR